MCAFVGVLFNYEKNPLKFYFTIRMLCCCVRGTDRIKNVRD